jgi:hypothetical protein
MLQAKAWATAHHNQPLILRSNATRTFDTINTKKSFSLIAHDSTLLLSGSTLPASKSKRFTLSNLALDPTPKRLEIYSTRIDDLLALDSMTLRLLHLLLQIPDSIRSLSVDLS